MKLIAIALLVLGGFIKEQEPNNRIHTAQFIGDLFKESNRFRVKGELRYLSDIDYYKFRVHEDMDLRLTIITGALSVPLIPGFRPLGGMNFAPWLQISNSQGDILVNTIGFSGNLFINNLHINGPTTLYVRVAYGGEALYPKTGPDTYYLKVADPL